MKRDVSPTTIILAILIFSATAWAYYIAVTID